MRISEKRYRHMPEEIAAPVVETAAPEAAPAVGNFNSFVGDDGTLAEGWKESISEEYRGEKCLDTFSDIPGMIKTIVHGQKAFGKDKVILPSELSPVEDWDAFHKAIGRPETADDYTMNRPEDIPEDSWSSDVVSQFKDLAHQLGLNQKQVDGIASFNNALTTQGLQHQQDKQDKEVSDAEQAMRSKYGDAYEERMGLADRIVADTTEPGDNRDALLAIIGNSPVAIEWVANMGARLMESGSVDTKLHKSTPIEMEVEISDLRSTPGYMTGELKKSDPARYRQVHDKITRLYLESTPVS
jgi:hypothetical protein